MSIIESYSQCQEDIYLLSKFFNNKRNGVYIEMGALDGVLYSNTKMFEDYYGWSGILIEPHPLKFKDLQNNRPKNFLFNDLVSNSNEELKFRYFENFHAAVSGVEKTLSENHVKTYFDNSELQNVLPQSSVIIKPKSLTEIIKSTNITHIDLFSLDVEGHEYEVLLSWDFSIPIDIILIEMLGVQPERDQLCRDILLNKGYKFHSNYKHNEIYVSNSFSK